MYLLWWEYVDQGSFYSRLNLLTSHISPFRSRYKNILSINGTRKRIRKWMILTNAIIISTQLIYQFDLHYHKRSCDIDHTRDDRCDIALSQLIRCEITFPEYCSEWFELWISDNHKWLWQTSHIKVYVIMLDKVNDIFACDQIINCHLQRLLVFCRPLGVICQTITELSYILSLSRLVK